MSLYRIVPNYELAPDMQDIEILRVVVRENFSEAVGLVIRSFFHEDTNIKIHSSLIGW